MRTLNNTEWGEGAGGVSNATDPSIIIQAPTPSAIVNFDNEMKTNIFEQINTKWRKFPKQKRYIV